MPFNAGLLHTGGPPAWLDGRTIGQATCSAWMPGGLQEFEREGRTEEPHAETTGGGQITRTCAPTCTKANSSAIWWL